MSDAKRPGGSRDISDLKQRLGLKKGGAAQPGGGARANGAPGGGVVPPPGLNLPPPPGMAPPKPVIPNAAEDPFGAMNAMAAVGTVQRAPEIVIVNDGKPVENVGSSGLAMRVAKVAIPAIATLALGVAVGKSSANANHHNEGVAGGKALIGDTQKPGTIEFLKAKIAALDNSIGGRKDLTPSPQDEKDFSAVVDALAVPPERLAVARNITNRGKVAVDTIKWYGRVAELQALLETHIKAGKYDAQQKWVEKAKANGEAAKFSAPANRYYSNPLRYAIVMSAKPTCDDEMSADERRKKGCDTAPFGAQFVELGPPMCNDSLSSSGTCPDGANVSPSYRLVPDDPTKGWSKGQFVSEQADSVPTKGLIPLVETPVLMTFLKDNAAGASELMYTRRLKQIQEMAQTLVKEANKLKTDILKNVGDEKFTFFL